MQKIMNGVVFSISILLGFLLSTAYKEIDKAQSIEDSIFIPQLEEGIIKPITIESNYDKYVKLVETGIELQKQRIEEERLERERKAAERFKKIEEKWNLIYSGVQMEFTLTFYSGLASENCGYTTTAWGEVPQYGMVASNVYERGTRIYLEGFGEFVVSDRGGSNFDNYNRLDVFIPRLEGESDYEYSQRVLSLGVVTTTGYIY